MKTPILKEADILIASACLPYVSEEIFRNLSKDKVVLLACPERELATHYGKIASIIRSSKPKSIIVATVDGSPHCFTLHASVNEAEYILGMKLNKRHYVVVDAKDLIEINPDAIRVARYLHIVNKLIEKYPDALKELEKHSLGYKLASQL